jgi:hypothetical protein
MVVAHSKISGNIKELFRNFAISDYYFSIDKHYR